VHHTTTNHVDRRYHFVRQILSEGQTVLKFTSTEAMMADELTRNLTKKKHHKFVRLILFGPALNAIKENALSFYRLLRSQSSSRFLFARDIRSN